MAATRTLLLKTGIIADIGTISLLVTIAGVVGALAICWAVRGTRLGFLFERPARFRLAPAAAGAAAGGVDELRSPLRHARRLERCHRGAGAVPHPGMPDRPHYGCPCPPKRKPNRRQPEPA